MRGLFLPQLVVSEVPPRFVGEGARAEVPISAQNQEYVTSSAGDSDIAHLAKAESTWILHGKRLHFSL